MEHIIADESLLAWLGGLKEAVEVRAPHGELLGYYTPLHAAEQDALYERARQLFDFEAAKRVTPEDRAKARPFSEIIRRLEAQEKQK